MVNVFITVDVETSIGGAFKDPETFSPVGADKRIWGRVMGKEYGISFIMDILEDNDLRATFFVESLCTLYFGKEMLQKVCSEILKRGHDIQLHIHPNYQVFRFPDWRQIVKHGDLFSDNMMDYSFEDQVKLIRMGKEILSECGITPVAFRAGSFGANRDTLKALRKNSFIFDSSYNSSFLGKTCFISEELFNDVFQYDGISEVPITNYVNKIWNIGGLRHLDVCAASFLEMQQVLNICTDTGPNCVTFIVHSFSFLKNKDVQYKKTKPNFLLINRFKSLCKFLKENRKFFKVLTFSDIGKNSCFLPCESNHEFPKVSKKYVLKRMVEQLYQKL